MNESTNIFATLFNGPAITSFFFKIFGCLFSLMYLIYTVIVYKQIETMARMIQIIDTGVIKRENFIVFFTRLQILIALLVFIFSIFVFFS